jgi:hypothetical protein
VIIRTSPKPPEESGSDHPFINELHYDNESGDVNEFVEIILHPNFNGSLAEIVLHLYNGDTGMIYGENYPLSSFIEGATLANGSRIFYRNILGIQNGSPDGMALVSQGQVVQFLSYEGTFTAHNGPAIGMTSTNIGVLQPGTASVGMDSLGLTGEGSGPTDFIWALTSGPFTPGQLNAGQHLPPSTLPQGLAIDDFAITPLSDRDGDRISDREEYILQTNPHLKDSDSDGQDDFFEAILAGTNPLLNQSFYSLKIDIIADGQTRVTTPTVAGRIYHLESSSDLVNWTTSEPFLGTGQKWSLDFSKKSARFFRSRITLP